MKSLYINRIKMFFVLLSLFPALFYSGCKKQENDSTKLAPTKSPEPIAAAATSKPLSQGTTSPALSTPPSFSTTPVTPPLSVVPTNTPLTNSDQLSQLPDYEAAYQAFHGGKYKEAVKLADSLINIDPTHYKAMNIKGIALSFQDRHEEGMKWIDKALAHKPDYGYARFNKALAYEYHEEISKALEWYDKALEIENYVWSHYGKASCYGRLGDVQNAVKNLTVAMVMDSGVKNLARHEKDFYKVRNAPEFQALMQ